MHNPSSATVVLSIYAVAGRRWQNVLFILLIDLKTYQHHGKVTPVAAVMGGPHRRWSFSEPKDATAGGSSDTDGCLGGGTG